MDTNQPTSLDQSNTETFPSSDNDDKVVSLNGAIAQENSQESVSDDGGFASGDEGIVEDGNSDLPFVGAPSTVESLVNNDDDGIFDVNSEIVESTEKSDVNLDESGEVLDVKDRNLVGEVVERKVEEFSDVKAKEDVASDSGAVKYNEEGDSVVDNISAMQVDVANPGVVVVGETKENADVENSRQVLDVDDRNLVVEGVESKVEESSEVGADEEVTSSSVDDKLIEEGDSVVDNISAMQVDVANPGVVVVGETKENADVENSRQVLDVDDRNLVVEGVESKVEEFSEVGADEEVTSSSVDDKLIEEGDSVFDSINDIKIDVAAPGVVVVGETKENEDIETSQEVDVAKSFVVEEVERKSEESSEVEAKEDVTSNSVDDKLTEEGDSIVDTISAIQVDVAAPGVAVVGKVEENEVEKVEWEVSNESVGDAEDNSKSVEEPVTTENKFDILQQNAQSENLEIVDENLSAGAAIDSDDVVRVERSVKEGDVEHEPKPVIANDVSENGVASKPNRDGEIEIVDKSVGWGTMQSNSEHSGVDKEVEIVDKKVGLDLDGNQLESTNADAIKSNGVHSGEDGEVKIADKTVDLDIDVNRPQNTNTVTMRSNGVHSGEEANPDVSDGEDDDLVFGSESAKKFIEELEQESGLDSHAAAGNSLELSQRMDSQIVTDSEHEEGDSDDEEDGKVLFDPSALAALLKAATGSDSGITISSQDGSRLFSVERPAGMGSSLRAIRPTPQSTHPTLFSPLVPSTGMESEENLSKEEKTKLEKLQQIRVKYLRLVHRLGLSTEEPVAEQVLYRLALLGGRRNTQSFNLEAAKLMASHLDSKDGNDLDFSVKILVIGKSGVGKSATINSIFGDEKASIDAFEAGTGSVKEVNGYVHGVNINIVDTPGLKSYVMEQGFNRSVLSTVQKLTKKSPPDVVLYVDRLDAQTRDLKDLPMLKTVTRCALCGPSRRTN